MTIENGRVPAIALAVTIRLHAQNHAGQLSYYLICLKNLRNEQNFSHALSACAFIDLSLGLATLWLRANDCMIRRWRKRTRGS
jgi:hypothetical protein